jgi:hypothetical protein
MDGEGFLSGIIHDAALSPAPQDEAMLVEGMSRDGTMGANTSAFLTPWHVLYHLK